MKLIAEIVYYVGVVLIFMGATNTAIRFAENTHKYGPVLLKKLEPVYPVFPMVLRRAVNPYAIGIFFLVGLPIVLNHFSSPPEAMAVDPFSLLPFDLFGIGL